VIAEIRGKRRAMANIVRPGGQMKPAITVVCANTILLCCLVTSVASAPSVVVLMLDAGPFFSRCWPFVTNDELKGDGIELQ
jgi:hypothetical protein